MYFAASLPSLATDDSAIEAAVDALNDRWPWTLSWQELVDAARARMGRAENAAAPDIEARIVTFSSA
jgi:hypothetical protein